MTGTLMRSVRTTPRIAAFLLLPMLAGLAACENGETQVETAAGSLGTGASSPAVSASSPEPEPEPSAVPGSDPTSEPEESEKPKGPGFGARTDPEGMELGREAYKRLKEEERNGKPGHMVVCKFPDGRLAGVVYRTLKPADPSAPKVSDEQYKKSLRDFCASKYKGTWEDEDPK